MKKVLGLVFLMLFLISATEMTSPKPHAKKSIEGTWELVSHYNYDNNIITDTILANENLRQVKMFYNGKVMWARYVPQDSTEWFGYGSYETTEDRLRERLEFGSAAIMKIADTLMVFELELILDETSYSQINIDDEGNRLFSENYKRLD
ncbi:hypothetical protein GGR42_002616 [Saonia flava]|uniref:Lipocalin-like domain-containing protein n=1 Tax=Saonia flava TaxID=523696 RepID=A0A846R2F8_9FLAO|nr:hypothetical protein [Saonia flava]NJB72125.1 hypothetical protein [Saonia flava]